jgi:hypothetical protein
MGHELKSVLHTACKCLDARHPLANARWTYIHNIELISSPVTLQFHGIAITGRRTWEDWHYILCLVIRSERTLPLHTINRAWKGSLDVPASGYICAIFLSVGSGTKHSIYFSRLDESHSLYFLLLLGHTLPHTLPPILISFLYYFVIGAVYKSPGHYSVTTLTLYVQTGKHCPMN